MKDNYIKYAKENFEGKALELVLNNIELFYNDNVFIKKNKYSIGEYVFVKKRDFSSWIRRFV